MICLALGLGVLGLAAMRRARRCHGGWHRHHHHYGRRRWMLHHMLRSIDASPAQERAIVSELEKLEERLWTARRGIKDGRDDLAAAIRGPVLDDAALGAVLGRIDGTTHEVREAGIEALRNIHAVLDDGQRARVADILSRNGGPWSDRGSWRSGPYR